MTVVPLIPNFPHGRSAGARSREIGPRWRLRPRDPGRRHCAAFRRGKQQRCGRIAANFSSSLRWPRRASSRIQYQIKYKIPMRRACLRRIVSVSLEPGLDPSFSSLPAPATQPPTAEAVWSRASSPCNLPAARDPTASPVLPAYPAALPASATRAPPRDKTVTLCRNSVPEVGTTHDVVRRGRARLAG
jgi:hypothetical protein